MSESNEQNKEEMPKGSGSNEKEILKASGSNKEDTLEASGSNKEEIREVSGSNNDEIREASDLNNEEVPEASGPYNEEICEGTNPYKRESVEGSNSVIFDIRRRLQLNSYDPSTHSISNVPNFLRRVNKEAYDPTIVAIGPIHHNSLDVQVMEQHKVWYLQQLLVRMGTHNLDMCIGVLRESKKLARKYYSSSIELPATKEFVEMLLLDGVFIIELARRWSSKKLITNDYIFQYSEVHYNEVLIQIRRDLLMIENQVPFFILEKLFDLIKEDTKESLCCLLLHFFRRIIPGEPGIDSRIREYDVDDHILGLVYEAYFSDINIDLTNNREQCMFHEINSTSELQEAGIQFKRAETTTLMNVKFYNGVIEIPKLEVGDVTESLFRNLIAYEQIRIDDDQTRADDNPRYVTEYCFLMQFLVNSTKDVEILRRAGIVISWLGNDETVRLFFNKLTKNVATSQDFYYAHTIRTMNEYCGHHRNRWRAIIKRNYFNRPWVILSITATIILLLLTVAQTVVTILK